MTKNQTRKFFIYARKSTDTEDRQVRSIGDQISELRELAVAVYQQIYYYNHKRIHSKLKMPPAIYARRYVLTNNYVAVRV